MKTNTTLQAAGVVCSWKSLVSVTSDVTTTDPHGSVSLRNDLNKLVWQISFKACRASVLQLVAVKSWQRSFLSMLYLKKKKKNEARKRQWQMAINRWDLATKKWEPKHHDVLCSKHFEKTTMLHISYPGCWALSLGSNTCPQGNRLGNISSSNLQGWSSDAIASSWVFVYFPSSFHLSRALFWGAWCFVFFAVFTLAFTTG